MAQIIFFMCMNQKREKEQKIKLCNIRSKFFKSIRLICVQNTYEHHMHV